MMKPATAFIAGYYDGYQAAHGQPPNTLAVSASLFEAYSDEIMMAYRFVKADSPHERGLFFRAMRVVPGTATPWKAEVVA